MSTRSATGVLNDIVATGTGCLDTFKRIDPEAWLFALFAALTRKMKSNWIGIGFSHRRAVAQRARAAE